MYHLTDKGEPKPCKAKAGKCPYAAERHFESQQEARAAYEASQQGFLKSSSSLIKHEMKLSEDVVKLMDQLQAEELTPYIVGGSVRDSLISGAAPKDIDIEVFGVDSMDQLETTLRKNRYRVDSVGKSFGVLKLQLPSGEDIDISLPRRDSKVGDGHRGFEVEVDPSLSLEDAAGRRDFTINSLYYAHGDKVIRDPFGGVKDWDQGQLRHINEHFGEDPLRVIRGVQFAARFSMKIAPETVELSRSMRHEFANLSDDRIQTEFEKFFVKGNLSQGFAALRQTQWDQEMGLDYLSQEDIEKASAAKARAAAFNEDVVVFASSHVVANAPGKSPQKIANLLVTGLKRQQKALKLQKEVGPEDSGEKATRKWARSLGKRGLTAKDYYIFSGDEKAKVAAEKYGVFEVPDADLVTGAMVVERRGEKPGPWIGKLLSEANRAQDEREFTDSSGAQLWLDKALSKL